MNEENLIPLDERTKSEQREIAKKGGQISGRSRRKKKEFRELFESMLAEKGGELNGKKATRKDMVVARAIKLLLSDTTKDSDFLKALELVRDTIGEKPVEKIQVAGVSQEVIDEVERAVLSDDQTASD